MVKHLAMSALIAFVVVALVGHVSALKTLAGWQATS
jgi:hypothetical protein